MKTLGIIFLVVAGLSFILCIVSTYLDFSTDFPFFFSLTLGCVTAILGAKMVSEAKTPTDKDVLNGKAKYQETLHITETDTIKTYKIVWKNNCAKSLP